MWLRWKADLAKYSEKFDLLENRAVSVTSSKAHKTSAHLKRTAKNKNVTLLIGSSWT